VSRPRPPAARHGQRSGSPLPPGAPASFSARALCASVGYRRSFCCWAPLARNVTELVKRLQAGKRRWLHHAGSHAQITLRDAVSLPEYAQEGPKPERYRFPRQPYLQCANAGTARIADKMRKTVVRHSLAPMMQNFLANLPRFRFLLCQFSPRDQSDFPAGWAANFGWTASWPPLYLAI
jgi:hypothetical protein